MGAPSISNVNTPGPNIANVPTTRVNLLGIDISFAQLASPPPDILANTAMVYQTPDGNVYQSNGTSLAGMGGGAQLTVANNWLLAQSSTLSTIAYAATITIDGLAHSNHINIGTLTGNLFLANPTNWTNAGTVNIHSTQDATGSRLISFGTKFRAAGGIGSITLSTAANAWDVLSYVYHPTKDLYFLAIAKAVA